VLAATPNDMLLPGGEAPAQSRRDRLLARINAASDSLSLPELDLAASNAFRRVGRCREVERAARERRQVKGGASEPKPPQMQPRQPLSWEYLSRWL
jgi:hypothetical protein